MVLDNKSYRRVEREILGLEMNIMMVLDNKSYRRVGKKILGLEKYTDGIR